MFTDHVVVCLKVIAALMVLIIGSCAASRSDGQAGGTAPTPAASAGGLRVEPITDEVWSAFELDPFYRKMVNLAGLPVIGSARVNDYALLEGAYLIGRMLGDRDDLRRVLIERRIRVVIMAYNEYTTDIPEHSDLDPAEFWDRRARGLGATLVRPAISGAEENLLGYPGDHYAAECILIHEFAHTMHEIALAAVDPTFDERLAAAYEAAIAAGLWQGTYAATNRSEYWAEGVQGWFDTNRQNDDQHNHVDTRVELRTYDPALAELLAEIYGDGEWRYVRPRDRAESRHLAGYDPAGAPSFEWRGE
ncbi:MAG: hypothetical protein JSV91_10765 [Phycisphaerales bacterium]|nr:MAG: hypothetical protein JSV91_10765 [Phycisphaerales bacterium]